MKKIPNSSFLIIFGTCMALNIYAKVYANNDVSKFPTDDRNFFLGTSGGRGGAVAKRQRRP